MNFLFYVQSYLILAGWLGRVRAEQQCLKEEEENVGQENKKQMDESQDGVHSEFFNEHTHKKCLSFRLAEKYPSDNPKFMFRTPVTALWNKHQVCSHLF